MNTAASVLSPGAWCVVALAIVSSLAVAFTKSRPSEGLEMWVFARSHHAMYEPVVEHYNQTHSPRVALSLVSAKALERRMLASFFSGIPVADLFEVEMSSAPRAFAGPLDAVGFRDLTDRLASEGLTEQLVPASLSPWSSRGRVFGLPHDIHPVMLGYRADIIEDFGIDLSTAETWDDFFRLLRPLVADLDGDNRPDRFALALWPTQIEEVEILIRQAGGRMFDDQMRPDLSSEINARTAAAIVSWMIGPDRVVAQAKPFNAAGTQLKLTGYVLATLMPDWMCGVYKQDMPQLAGKMKLMPLPAWKKGGRRTSVWGGTMLGFPKSSDNFEAAWELGKSLYFSREIARKLYEEADIITPIKRFWSDEAFHRPDPYFSGQRKGAMYIALAEDIPRRSPSPFNAFARARLKDAIIGLRRWAEAGAVTDLDALTAEARVRLEYAQAQVVKQIDRNVFAASSQ